jgi:hypothetical protein
VLPHGIAASLRQSCRMFQSRNHLALDDKWKRTETALRKVAENTIGYTRKQALNEWFDEECGVVNEEKNALKAIDT